MTIRRPTGPLKQISGKITIRRHMGPLIRQSGPISILRPIATCPLKSQSSQMSTRSPA